MHTLQPRKHSAKQLAPRSRSVSTSQMPLRNRVDWEEATLRLLGAEQHPADCFTRHLSQSSKRFYQKKLLEIGDPRTPENAK